MAERLTGWKSEEASGKVLEDVLSVCRASDHGPVGLPALGEVEDSSGCDPHSALLLQGRTGTQSLVYAKFRPVRDASGITAGLAVILRDFTSTRETEKVIIENETRLQRVIEGSRLGYWDWNLESGNVVFSGRWATMLGYDPDELGSDFATWEGSVHPEDKPLVMAALRDLLEGRTDTYEQEHRLRTKEGGWRWILTRGNIVERDSAGRPRQLAGTHTDIHDKKAAEAAAHRRDEETIRFQKALLALRDHEGGDINDFLWKATAETCAALCLERAGVWLFEADGQAIVCQDLFVQSKGEHSRGMRISASQYPHYFKTARTDPTIRADDALTHPDTCEFAGDYFRLNGITSMLDVPIRLGNQTLGLLCCEHTGPARKWTAEEEKFAISMAGSVLLALENVRRRKAESAMRDLNENLERLVASRTQELRKSERRFHDLFEFAPDATVMANQKGVVTLVNHAVERLFGHRRNEILGRSVGFLVEGLGARVEEAKVRLKQGATTVSFEFGRNQLEGIRRDGTRFPVEASLSPMETDRESGLVISLRDVTERERSQKLLLRTQRLESIGTLAGGVAHDLNNALSPILLAVEMLRERYPAEGKLINLIENSARRGTEMVRQLLTFAKGVEGARLHIRTEDLFREIGQFVGGTFPKNIRLEVVCPEGLPSVLGDATQLHQVLLNLCVNARDSMLWGGRLNLSACLVEMTAEQASAFPDAHPGTYVQWRVADTGTGIPPDIQERIFEPFFSTKDPEKGTGLGLANVLGIVRSHGGFIRLNSAPGDGSTFFIHLPAGGRAVPGVEAQAAPSRALDSRGDLVMVVDDEEMVRDMATALLNSMGFRVITACDGVEGLHRAVEHEEDLKAVLTDLHMPRMDGMDLVRALRSQLPGAGIIVTSGRLDERQIEDLKRAGAGMVLAKPFRQKELVEALQTVLGRG